MPPTNNVFADTLQLVYISRAGERDGKLMTFDGTLSLDIILAILAVVGAVWHLDGKIAASRDKLEGDIKDSRNELKNENAATRIELRGDIQRLDAKLDETRKDLKNDIQRVDDKIDEGNQRLARLEGRFEGREERLEPEREADTTA